MSKNFLEINNSGVIGGVAPKFLPSPETKNFCRTFFVGNVLKRIRNKFGVCDTIRYTDPPPPPEYSHPSKFFWVLFRTFPIKKKKISENFLDLEKFSLFFFQISELNIT